MLQLPQATRSNGEACHWRPKFKFYTAHCTRLTGRCRLQTVHHWAYTADCTLLSIYCTVRSVQSAECRLHSWKLVGRKGVPLGERLQIGTSSFWGAQNATSWAPLLAPDTCRPAGRIHQSGKSNRLGPEFLCNLPGRPMQRSALCSALSAAEQVCISGILFAEMRRELQSGCMGAHLSSAPMQRAHQLAASRSPAQSNWAASICSWRRARDER